MKFVFALFLPMVSMVLDKKYLNAFAVSCLAIVGLVPELRVSLFTSAIATFLSNPTNNLELAIEIAKYDNAVIMTLWLFCGAWAVDNTRLAEIKELKENKGLEK